MPTVMCVVEKDIEIGAVEKEIVPEGRGNRYHIARESKVIPYRKIEKGSRVQLRHGWNGITEQRVYVATKGKCGWFMTKNQEGYSLKEVFRPIRKNRSPWEALY